MQEKVDEGETVYAPNTQSRKRKRAASFESDEDETRADYQPSSQTEQNPSDPLTADDVETKINELKSRRKEVRRERTILDGQIKEANIELKSTTAKKAK